MNHDAVVRSRFLTTAISWRVATCCSYQWCPLSSLFWWAACRFIAQKGILLIGRRQRAGGQSIAAASSTPSLFLNFWPTFGDDRPAACKQRHPADIWSTSSFRCRLSIFSSRKDTLFAYSRKKSWKLYLPHSPRPSLYRFDVPDVSRGQAHAAAI